MPIQLYIGFTVEGTTDTRFLTQIIQNVFEDIAFDCRTDVVIEDVRTINVSKDGFNEMMLNASKQAAESGITVLCIHADADAKNIEDVMKFKIRPFVNELNSLNPDDYCKAIVPVIPIQMTEAWMMADKELLKEKIAAKGKRDSDLGLEKPPEAYADPKKAIIDAINIARAGKTKRRRKELTIDDLYDEMGQSITLPKLRKLESFCAFEQNVKSAFKLLGYID
jgi:hypothetical protein